MARNPHPLSGEYRTLRSGRKVWIDDRGVAHFVSPQGNLVGAQHYDPQDYDRERYLEGLAEQRQEDRLSARDEAREWGGEDIPS